MVKKRNTLVITVSKMLSNAISGMAFWFEKWWKHNTSQMFYYSAFLHQVEHCAYYKVWLYFVSQYTP